MILNERKLKVIIKKILNESRFILGDYEDEEGNLSALKAANVSKRVGDQSKEFPRVGGEEERQLILDSLYDMAGPDVFISFVDAWEFDHEGFSKSPKFSLNPTAKFSTPHGIYAYPFDKKQAVTFIETGSPTDSPFATERKYFHLIRIDLTNPNVIVFNENGKSNRNISMSEYTQFIDELIRMHCLYFYDDLIKYLINNENDGLDVEYENFTDEDHKLLKQRLINEHMNSLKFELRLFFQNDKIQKNKMANDLYYKLYKAAYFLSFNQYRDRYYSTGVEGKQNDSQFYSLLLNRIGIKCVIDKNTSSIHPSEPDQMHILTLGDDSSFYEYLGTHRNDLHNAYNLFEFFLKKCLNVKDVFAVIDKPEKKIYMCNILTGHTEQLTVIDDKFRKKYDIFDDIEEFGEEFVDIEIDRDSFYEGIEIIESFFPIFTLPVDWNKKASEYHKKILICFTKKVKISDINIIKRHVKKIAQKNIGLI
jgi:hypothetical protein